MHGNSIKATIRRFRIYNNEDRKVLETFDFAYNPGFAEYLTRNIERRTRESEILAAALQQKPVDRFRFLKAQGYYG